MDSSRNLLHENLIRRMKKIFDDRQDLTILDLWCAQGDFLSRLHDEWFTFLFGTDWFRECTLPFVEFKKSLFTQKLDYQNESFDIIFFLDVYEHLWDPMSIVTEIHRILKKDGICVITTPNISSIFWRISFLLTGKLWGFQDQYVVTEGEPWHINPFVINIFLKIFEDAFSLLHDEAYWLHIPWLGIVNCNSTLLSGTRALYLKKK